MLPRTALATMLHAVFTRIDIAARLIYAED